MPTVRRENAMALSGAIRASRVGRVLGVLDRTTHRFGVRLLSRNGLRVVVGLSTIASLAVNAATLPSLYEASVPLALAVSVLQSAGLGWALTRPWFAIGTASVASAATSLLTLGAGPLPWPVPVVTLVTLALLAFILAVREHWWLPVVGALAPLVLTALVAMPVNDGSRGRFGGNLVTAAAILALVVTFGILIHQWLTSRAELLEQQSIAATAQERRLLMEERNRIARELHDVVAHGLSVISIQASTMRYRVDGIPPPAQAELDEITDSARGALAEMRGLLAVLRQDDGENELAPQPTLSAIGDLVDSARRGAVVVRLDVTGDLASTSVTDAVSRTAYRIVQEALSNALRHAPGSEIRVGVAVAEDVRIEVENTPPTVVPATTGGGGHGLRGMRERASFVHGVLEVGPTSSGGYRVRAVLPGIDTGGGHRNPTER